METIIHWLENHRFACFYKSMLGIECPGCGIQRAFILLLKGELSESFFTYPPLLFFLLLLFFLFLHLFFRFKNGGIYLKYLFIAAACAVMINFICKSSKNETVRKMRNEESLLKK